MYVRGIADIGLIIATLVSLVVVLGVSWIVITQVQSAFQNVGANAAAEGTSYGKDALTAFGKAATVIIILMGVAAMILAYFVRTHPIFFPITLTIGTIFIILGAVFANFSEEFLKQVDAVTGDFSAAFGSLVWLAINQPIWIAVLAFGIIVLTYTGKAILEAS